MEPSRYTCEGLPTGDILISDIREEVSEATVCRYFGPKSSKSGWKYSSLTTVEEQSAILSLYRKVYESEDPPNKEITLSFAKGLILMSQGRSVNWAQFAAERRKVREALRQKAEDRKVKRDREREGAERKEGSAGSLSIPSVLGKKRCMVGREGIGFPGSFSLSVKSEFTQSEGLGMGRKSSTKSGRGFGGPRWSEDEIASMGKAIEWHEALAQACKTSLVASRRELEGVEDKLRREKLLMSDRQLMLDEVKLRLSRLSEEELPLQCAVEEKTRALADLENGLGTASIESVALRKDIAALTSERDGFFFRKAADEHCVRLCGEAIAGCSGKVKDLQVALRTSSESTARTELRVSCLESALLSMREQLTRMQVADGAALYPRPLESSPEVPVVLFHTLNACPVCSMWFECFNYSSLACGHTYHPYCLAEYASKASECLVPSCHEPFASKSLAAIGIRPTTRPAVEAKVLRSETEEVSGAKSNHDTAGATTGAASSPISYWEKKSPEKITPLSQSSQTDATSKQCSLKATENSSSPVVCELCGVKEASVFIKACGHDVFCFPCIQGLQQCPICDGAITGWGRISPRSKPSPTLILPRADSEHDNHGTVPANTVHVEDKSDCPVDDAEKADSFVDDSSDGSDTDNGLVQWCGSDTFSNGGARSLQDLLQSEIHMQDEESDLPLPQVLVGSCNAKRFAVVSNLVDTVKTGPQLDTSSQGCKRGRPRHPTQTEGRKFKKIVEMAADSGKMENEEATDMERVPELRKRSVGRPPSLAKRHGQKLSTGTQASKQGGVKSASLPVQKMRSTLRRREAQETIPVKFRGM